MATVAGTPAAAPLAAPPKTRGLTGRARAERKLGLMLTLPAVAVMLLVAGFPILYAFWLSLHRADLRFPHLTAWIGLDNYWYVLSSSTWWTDVLNTVIITVVSLVLELVLGLLIAEAIPACSGPAAESTVEVSGATVMTRPIEKTSTPGRTSAR